MNELFLSIFDHFEFGKSGEELLRYRNMRRDMSQFIFNESKEVEEYEDDNGISEEEGKELQSEEEIDDDLNASDSDKDGNLIAFVVSDQGKLSCN